MIAINADSSALNVKSFIIHRPDQIARAYYKDKQIRHKLNPLTQLNISVKMIQSCQQIKNQSSFLL